MPCYLRIRDTEEMKHGGHGHFQRFRYDSLGYSQLSIYRGLYIMVSGFCICRLLYARLASLHYKIRVGPDHI